MVKVSGEQKVVGIYRHPRSIAFQDELYGKGYRVHTPLISIRGVKYRCTVCGKES